MKPWSFCMHQSQQRACPVVRLTYELGVFSSHPGMKGGDSPQNLGENEQLIVKWPEM